MAKSKKRKKPMTAEAIAAKQVRKAEKRRNGNLGMLSIIISIVCLVIVAAMTPSILKSHNNPYTYSEFQKITDGMSYDEVSKILGGDGELQTGVGTGEGGEGIALYVWTNKNGSNVSVTFVNDAAEGFAQSGLDK